MSDPTRANILRTEDRFPPITGVDPALREIDSLKTHPNVKDFFHNGQGRPRANVVFQGGGVLGIAHVGFLYGLERAGVRVAGVAGTSAGAIVAVLIASARRKADDAVAGRLVPLLWRMPAKSFIDGSYRVRRLIKSALRGKSVASVEMGVPLLAAARRVLGTYGLNTGNAFLNWLSTELAREFQIGTVGDLDKRLAAVREDLIGDVKARLGALAAHAPPDRKRPLTPQDLLQVVATGLPQAAVPLTIGRKFVFPRDLSLFSSRYEHRSPALLARASMSVPLFFEPLVLDLDRGPWRETVMSEFGPHLSTRELADLAAASDVAFLDGGLLSNFPIDAFATGPLTAFPTIGVALVGQRAERTKPPKGSVAALAGQVGRVVDAMRHVRDRDAAALARVINDSGGPKVRVAFSDVGMHNWLNFQLDEYEMADLFRRGVDGAVRFLRDLSRPST